jgi:hypothetical protein
MVAQDLEPAQPPSPANADSYTNFPIEARCNPFDTVRSSS